MARSPRGKLYPGSKSARALALLDGPSGFLDRGEWLEKLRGVEPDDKLRCPITTRLQEMGLIAVNVELTKAGEEELARLNLLKELR